MNSGVAQLFLKDHDPQGLFQGGSEERVGRFPGLSMEPGDPRVNALVGRGPDDGCDHHVQKKVVQLEVLFESEAGAHFFQRLPCRRTLKIEHPESVPLVEHFHGLWIIDGVELGVVDEAAGIFFHQR